MTQLGLFQEYRVGLTLGKSIDTICNIERNMTSLSLYKRAF